MKYLHCFLILLLHLNVYSQKEAIPWISPSPKGHISQVIGNTLVEIEYERPSVRNRVIYGGLVPWDRLWRTGAGRTTKLKFDKPVRIGGQYVAAGQYHLFTIPKPDKWVVILNQDKDLEGPYNYDSQKDVIRFVVLPKKTHRFYETFNIDLEIVNHNGIMYVSWEKTVISFEIETTTNEMMDKLITELLLTEKSKNPEDYTAAASYLNFMGKDYNRIIQFSDKAFELDNSLVYTKMWKKDIYIKLHQYEKALKEIEEIIAIRKKENDVNRVKKLEQEYEEINSLMNKR